MTEYVRDDFNRTVNSSGASPGGWGTGYLGGAWTVASSNTVNARMSVDGTRGRAEFIAGTGSITYGVLAGAQAALEAHGAIKTRCNSDTLPASSYLWLRVSGPTNQFAGYGIRVGRVPGAPAMTIAELVRGPADVPVTLATLPSIAWPTYTNYIVAELELVGTAPTTVRGRIFLAASPPADDAGWTTVSDATGPQAVGVYGYRGVRTASSIVSDLLVDSMYVASRLVPAFTWSFSDDGLTAIFDGATLTQGDPISHSWSFGDGSPAVTVQNASHRYAAAGTYSVTYTAWTRWATRRSVTQSVVVPGGVPLPLPGVKPAIYVNGEDICDRVYAASWSSGRERWPEESNGATVTLQVRGRMPDVVMGSPVVIALPPGAPDGTRPLFTGEVDTVTESLDPVEAKTSTAIIAQDVMAFLSRWHILPGSSFVEGSLPTRVLGLAPRGSTVYRQKWAGVPAGRWPTLKSLAMSADKLRTRTYLDLLRDGLRGSIATAYVAPDGAIVYAPLDPPVGTGYSSRILGGTAAPLPGSHWHLGEAAGTFVDSRGVVAGAANGTVTRGAPGLAPGEVDGALASSTAGGVNYGNVYGKGAGSRWTVAGYVTWDGTGDAYLFTKIATSPTRGWRAALDSAGRLRSLTADGVATQTLQGATVLTVGRAYHLAFVWDELELRAYIDGVLEVSAARTRSPLDVAATPLTTAIRGTMDELSIWNVALTPSQVRALVAPGVDLDTAGLDCPEHVEVARATTEGIVNRWTVGDGAALDIVDRASVETYGESSWSVGTGVLKNELSFPITDGVIEQMREPFAARVVTVPVRDWASRAYLAEPLDTATMDGDLYAILGVRHNVSLGDWKVELQLDRDPWTMTGTVPPVAPPVVRTTTQTFSCDMDALLASPNMGAGRATRLPVGWNGSVKFRSLVRFNLGWAHTPRHVVEADLLLDTAGQDVLAYGSSPQVQIDRITGSWSEGSSGGDGPPWTFNTSNSVTYPGPATTSSGRQVANVTNNEDTAVTIALTFIARAWADGAANRGIRLMSTNESATSRAIEFYSSEHSSEARRPKLRVTYEY